MRVVEDKAKQRRYDLLAWALVLFAWFYVFPYNQALNNPNERTRVLQARALLTHGQLHVGHTERDSRGRLFVVDLYGQRHGGMFVNDLALVCDKPEKKGPDCIGKLYPAKAPGTALLGLPALSVGSLLGLVSSGPEGERAAHLFLRLGGVVLPMLLCLLAMLRLAAAAGLDSAMRRRLLLATGLGSSLWTYSLMFVGHALAGGALVAALYFAWRGRGSFRGAWAWSGAAGLMAGAAVLLEYHAVFAAACLGGWMLIRANRRLLASFAAGAGIMALLFAGLHWAMFGHPARTGHAFLVSGHNQLSQSTGFLGMSYPHLGSFAAHLGDPYMGLGPLMPWLLAGGVLGLVLLFSGRKSALHGGAARTIAAMVVAYLLFVSCLDKWRMMNGWSVGPRYLVPALPMLALAAGLGWDWLARKARWLAVPVAGLAAASVLMVGAVTVVFPQPPDWVRNPFGELALPLLLEGQSVPSLGSFLGSFSMLPMGLILLVVAAWLCWPAERVAGPRRKTRFVAALIVALMWVGLWATFSPSEPKAVEDGRTFVRRTLEKR
ncbi:MAG: hypothetical protein JRF33_15680 [Deltaproteobacteria bacterium]|nr:hypothetical protein [Deltaproteobacteria bacterium]